MITIGLDESGSFEDSRRIKKFVGGIVYKGTDIEEEEKRIEEFFKGQCEALNLEYPRGIHTTEMFNERQLKLKLVEALKAYIKQSGNYHFACLIKGKERRKNFQHLSNIIDDENASNLYEHMVCQLIDNLLFYNDSNYDTRQVNLKIATRVYPTSEPEKIEEYRALGYQERIIKKENREDHIFSLTNQQTFKAAISTKMLEDKIKKPMEIDLKVQTINYRNSDQPTTPFLYLADFACDIIRDLLEEKQEDFDVETAYKVLGGVSGNEAFIWAYDDIDSTYVRLAECCENKDLIGALNAMYDMERSTSPFAKFYLKHWCKVLEGYLFNIFKPYKAELYLSSIGYMFSKEEKLHDRGLNLAEKLFDIMSKYNETHGENQVSPIHLYRAADMAGRGYNHVGDSIRARKYFDFCIENRGEVDIEEYMATLNRIVVINANEFNFDRAIEKLKPSLLGLDVWKETKQEVAEMMGLEKKKASCSQLRGKVLSSLGQYYAFKRSKEEALGYFKEALEEFSLDRKQRLVTLSYILHLALDWKDIGLYKKYEAEYFGSEDINKQFTDIVSNNKKEMSNDYKLFVYIKALDIFHSDRLEQGLLSRIVATDFEKRDFMIKEHPWELIYKHLAMLQFKDGKVNSGKKFMEKSLTTVKGREITIKLINLCTVLESFEYTGDEKEYRNALEEIGRLFESNAAVYEYFAETFSIKDQKEKGKKIIEKFTYTYM